MATGVPQQTENKSVLLVCELIAVSCHDTLAENSRLVKSAEHEAEVRVAESKSVVWCKAWHRNSTV